MSGVQEEPSTDKKPPASKGKKERKPFQKDAFKEKIFMDEHVRTEIQNEFTHDTYAIQDAVLVVATEFYELENQRSHDPKTFEEIGVMFEKLFSLCLAKKMAQTLTESDSLTYGSFTKAYIRTTVPMPTFMVPMVDMFGSFKVDGVQWAMIGQTSWCFTYACRALAYETEYYLSYEQEIGAGRREGFFVNMSEGFPFKGLFELVVGTLNAWSSTIPVQRFDVGGLSIEMKLPFFTSGVQLYYHLVKQVQGIPPYIVRMLQIANLVESLKDNTNKVEVPSPVVEALNKQMVYVVNWKMNEFSARLDMFARTVMIPMKSIMSVGFKVVEVTNFNPEGDESQLCVMNGVNAVLLEMRLPEDKKIFGWMLPQRMLSIKHAPLPYGLLSKESKLMAVRGYVSKARKV